LFRRPHEDTEDVAESWKGLTRHLDPARRWPQLMIETGSPDR
jgi:hypothetical protein